MAQVATDWRKAPLAAADYALCAYAEKLSLSPAEMTVDDISQLRAHGFDDRAIHDATQVIAYFNYINRLRRRAGCRPGGVCPALGADGPIRLGDPRHGRLAR